MHTHPSIRAVIFDMGGVLVRNMVPEPRNRLAEKHNLTPMGLEELVFGNPAASKATKGEGSTVELWEHVRSTLNLRPPELPAFIQTFWSSDRLDEELVDFIRSLRPRYKTGLLSNAWEDTRPALNARYPHLMEIFDVSIFSGEVKLAKPDPRIYHLIMDQLGVAPEETIFVDDFRQNIEQARSLGMQAILFKSSQQARQAVLECISSNGAE
jgi:epoxide hydrolase-like predicted phosphatase